MDSKPVGSIYWISGPVVRAHIDGQLGMSEQVWVGEDQLSAEVIEVSQDSAVIQVYEETSGLRIDEPVFGSGQPLSVTLGPGLLGKTFDGVQRPLKTLFNKSGIYITRGEHVSSLDTEKKWQFTPKAKVGGQINPGDVLGIVQETPVIEHRIVIPPGIQGKLEKLVEKGEYTVKDEIAVVSEGNGQTLHLDMTQSWPVRKARPVRTREEPRIPLITGQRVIDIFFPIAKGGTAAIPGGFGTGKTVTLHSLAKWSDADIIVYVGCGERGNEMTQVLQEFPTLKDPRTGRPLMERTVLIANTSNMPVAARSASIYTGLTIAEYYRDQGYNTSLIADSTSRWAQALREIAGRLQEMPAEEGYPAYLPSRLAAFYERAGRVITQGGEEGSSTVMGAVSPPGGDFSEPVTRHTQRFSRSFWALDDELANKRHFPAINWNESYSLYLEQLGPWWEKNIDKNWKKLRQEALAVLDKETDLKQIVQLVGPEALGDSQRWVLDMARLLREGFLQQNAYDDIDAFCTPEKQMTLLALIIWLNNTGAGFIDAGISYEKVSSQIDLPNLIRLKENVPNDKPVQIKDLQKEIDDRFEKLRE